MGKKLPKEGQLNTLNPFKKKEEEPAAAIDVDEDEDSDDDLPQPYAPQPEDLEPVAYYR